MFNGENTFGSWLGRKRKELGLTQKELANMAGFATITIRKIEAEERKPTKQILDGLLVPLEIAPAEQKEFFRFGLFGPGELAAVADESATLDMRGPSHSTLSVQALTPDEAERALELSGDLWQYWYNCGYIREGRAWLEDVLRQTDPKDKTPARARVLNGAGLLAWADHDYVPAQKWSAESVALWRTLGDERGLAHALIALGQALLGLGQTQEACAHLSESVQLFRTTTDTSGLASALTNLGSALLNQGDPATAQPMLEESVTLLRATGEKRQLAWALNSLGELARYRGDIMQAGACYGKSLTLLRETGQQTRIAQVLHNLGHVRLHQGDGQQAAHLFCESLIMRRAAYSALGMAECLAGLASAASEMGQMPRAAQLCGAFEATAKHFRLRLDRVDGLQYQRTRLAVRSRMTEPAWEEAYAGGKALGLARAVKYALQLDAD